MPRKNANDPRRETDHDPSAALPDDDLTAALGSTSPPRRTASTFGPGPEPKSAEPEKSFVSVPGYEIECLLGRGGMGVVYKARHLSLKRTVALKMVLAGVHTSSQQLARFRIEAQAVARLQHPNIVQIHEVGEADGQPYCALEFVDGGNLASRYDGNPMPARAAARLVELLARAMQLAHSRNVVHRDLKPANILLMADGTPKITDFGLARQLDSDSGETQAGAVMGTPSYMAPEQASGHAHEAGPAADVYALGAILYYCLTGWPPFKGKTIVETLDQVRTQEPTAPSRRQAGVPVDLETICLKCLRKEPENRYTSAAELADELVRYQLGKPIRARPVGRLERAVKWVKRNPVMTGMALAVVLAMSAGTLVSYLKYREAEAARQDEAAARRAVEHTLADSYTTSGFQASDSGKPAEALVWFAAACQRSVDDPVRERDNSIRFWSWARQLPLTVRALPNRGQVRAISFHPNGRFALARTHTGYALWNLIDEQPEAFPDGAASAGAVAWTRDGARLAMNVTGGRVGIYQFPQGKPVAEFEHPGAISALAFDESGKRLAVASDRLRIWDCERGEFITPAYVHPASVAEIVFSQRGDRVATACSDNMCRVWPAQGDASQTSPLFAPVPHLLRDKNHFPQHIVPAFIDSDRGLLTCSENATVAWIDTATGATVRTVRPGGGFLGWIATSPDRKYFVLNSMFNVQLYDSTNGKPVGTAISHTNFIYAAAFHPDGKSLLTASADRTARLWSVPDGKPLSTPVKHLDEVSTAEFLPRGNGFATGQIDGMMRIWKHDQLARRLPTGGSEAYVQIAPDGRHAIAAGFDYYRHIAAPRVLDLATGEPAGRPLDIGGGLLNNAAFSPEGKCVALLTSLPENGEQYSPGLKQRDQAGRVHFFDWSDGARLFEPLATPTEPIGAAFSPNGKRLAVVCAGGEILLVDMATGRSLCQSDHGAKYTPGYFLRDFVRFNPDGSRFVTWGLGNEARVWDADSGKLAFAIASNDSAKVGWLADVRFAPDGKLLATASLDKSVAVFDAATGRALGQPLRHPDWVFSLRFSPDGKHIVTACRDGMARIWDWQASKLMCPPMTHQDEVLDACYASECRFVLTGSRDQTFRVWDAVLGKPMCPPLPTGGYSVRIAVTPDNAHIVVAGRMPNLLVYRLADLVEPGPSPLGGLHELAEVISGLSLHPGGGTANLTTADWLERYKSFRSRNPSYQPLEYSAGLK